MEGSVRASIRGKKLLDSQRKDLLWLLNVLRGISAILIVLYHYTVQYEKSIGHIQPYTITVPWGCNAVYTFFILSGYLAVYTCKKNTTARGFLKKRFLKLYPMFWICMSVTTVYMFLIMPGRLPSLKQFFVNITMMPSLFNVEAVDGVYWTLIKEIMFYLGFALVIKITGVNSKKWLWIWFGITTLCAIYSNGPIDFPGSGKLAQILIPDYAFTFLAGSAVFYFQKAESKKEKWLMFLFLALCVCYCLCVHTLNVTVFFVGAIMAVMICSDKHVNDITEPYKRLLKPILIISDISYVLYLTHQFIGFGIIQFIESRGLVEELFVVIPILHAILLACFLHYSFEVPISNRLKK